MHVVCRMSPLQSKKKVNNYKKTVYVKVAPHISNWTAFLERVVLVIIKTITKFTITESHSPNHTNEHTHLQNYKKIRRKGGIKHLHRRTMICDGRKLVTTTFRLQDKPSESFACKYEVMLSHSKV